MNEFKATDKWYKDAAENEKDCDISAGKESTIIEETEMKRCPFCNGESSLSTGQMGILRAIAHYVECEECAASSDMFWDINLAISAWNKRV